MYLLVAPIESVLINSTLNTNAYKIIFKQHLMAGIHEFNLHCTL